MFAVRVITGDAGAATPTPPGYDRLVKSRLTIDTRSGELYGFCFELDDAVVIGESLSPTSKSRIEQIVKDRDRLTAGQRLLGNDILALVCIDSAAQLVTVAGSVSSTRPYYMSFREGAFCCSTSVKALAELGVPLEADENAYPEFLVYRFVTPPRTLYKGISKLIGGQALRRDLVTGQITHDNCYRFEHQDGIGRDESSIRDGLAKILRKQVGCALQNSSRPGVLLSGGLDSSLLASLAVQAYPDVTSTSSSFAFVDENDAESDYALSVAKHLGINHGIYEGSKTEFLTGLVESVWHTEEPVHHLQSVMLYLLFKNHARQDMLICGEGADGLFGNDMHSKLHKYGGAIAFARRTGALHLYRQLVRTFGISGYRWRFFAHNFSPDLGHKRHLLWTLGQYGNIDIVKQWLGCDDEAVIATHRDLMQNYRHESLLKQVTIQSLLCEGFVTMGIWGKLAESRNLALLYPFTAPDLIDYIVEVPWEMKLREPKYFVRSLLRSQNFPEPFITRPKMSFGFPYRYWALPNTMFQPIVDMAEESYDGSFLRSLQSTEPGRAMVLWNILSLFLWRRMFIDGISHESLSGEILERYKSQEHGE